MATLTEVGALCITNAITGLIAIWSFLRKEKTKEKEDSAANKSEAHKQLTKDFEVITAAYRELNDELKLKVESLEKYRREGNHEVFLLGQKVTELEKAEETCKLELAKIKQQLKNGK